MESKNPDVERIQSPEEREFQDCADRLGKPVQPDWVMEGDEDEPSRRHEGGELTSVRAVEHRGRKIVIRTTYEIEIDGRPYQGHAQVDEDGRIHCHAIPYDTFPSAVDFVKQLIELYPESFPGGERRYGELSSSEGRKEKKA